ncbi:ABC transporter permease [Aquihabitans daechungensis]|uniref:ABC transporter permease n=1 Tax=Aquihabitans daechungensis TaxID=1052257 RepID=UPI003BA1DE18
MPRDERLATLAAGAPTAEDRRHPKVLGTRYRRVLWQWTVHDFRGRYQRGGIQAGWAVLQPLFFVAVYVLVFGIIFDADSGPIPYLTYLLSGMVVFRLISLAISANTCISDNLHTLGHSSMPSEVLPLAQVVTGLVDLAVVLLAFVVTAAVQGISLHATAVLLPFLLIPVIALSAALATSLSIVQVFVPDIRFAGVIVVQFLFFARPSPTSPISFPAGSPGSTR